MPWIVPAVGLFAAWANPDNAVDQARLMADLRGLPTKRAARGDGAHVQGLIDTEAYLVERLRAMGYEPELFPLSWTIRKQEEFDRKFEEKTGQPRARPGAPIDESLADHTWNNITVELRGCDLPNEVLIVGAHFDAVPNCPGADDNGSGTAGLLEIARVLKDSGPMRRTVRLIFFNLEEVGLKGSSEYARSLKPKLDAGEETVIGMLSLEMLGYYSDAPNSQRSPLPKIEGVFDPPTVGDFITLATTKKHAPFVKQVEAAMHDAAPGIKTLAPDFLPNLPLVPPDMLRSDNGPFLFLGLPAVMVTDTSNFRNPNYHRRTDTIDTLDPERFTLTVRGLAGAIRAVAEPAPAENDPP